MLKRNLCRNIDRLIEYKINKYATYVSNLQWHLENNRVVEPELSKVQRRIKDYREVIDDLKELKSKAIEYETH